MSIYSYCFKLWPKARLLAIGGLSALLGVCFVSPAQAVVTGGVMLSGTALTNGGSFMKLTPPLSNPFGPPNSVGNNTFQDNNLYAFDEGQNILVPAPLAVDDLFGPAGAGVVPGNTVVASHYVFFDPGPSRSVVGRVMFDSDILGVISSTVNLGASDFLINTGVNYLNPALRGLESNDSVIILDSRTIEVRWTASTPGDYIRVLTQFSPGAENSVPEPLTATLGLMGLGLVGLKTRRRQSA